MPIRGQQHSPSVSDDSPFFRSLAALDDWAATASAAKRLTGVLPYEPRSDTLKGESNSSKGKLLVCHDYKGGYTEAPSALAYTFNFWSLCDTFIYFAHHRVTIPPSGWVNAAHRQGVKMLGTLIFEHQESQPDCLKLIVGRLPQTQTGPAQPSQNISLPVSRHYARLLADLAYQRGFDGYLLNVEVPLQGGVEQSRALSTWISLLESELKSRIGSHAQAIWYDSVILDGQLRWQDRLNSYNLPFFLPSTGFFTNYTWPAHYPSATAQYFLSLNDNRTTKQMNDIFVGVDVWGRGQHGGGGLGCYKALSHIDPKSLGLSVALFGHGWTWESQQDNPGWDWDTWWAYERLFWVGPQNESDIPIIKDEPDRQGIVCTHGPYQPLSDFFNPQPPPDPLRLPFFTSFSPGVGRAWFVEGVKVWEVEGGSPGWTDLDKTTSLGDMLWPRPTLSWHDMEREDAPPAATSTLTMDRAWLGGSSLTLTLDIPASTDDDFFRCVWLPIQSLAVTPGQKYTMTLVFKPDPGVDQSVELDVGLSVKVYNAQDEDAVDIASEYDVVEYDSGWQKLTVEFTVLSAQEKDVRVAAGLILGLIVADPTQPNQVSITLGALSVRPSLPPSYIEPTPKIIWASFAPSTAPASNRQVAGTLTWETGGQNLPLTSISVTSPDDPVPAWLTNHVFQPPFLYFNIYVIAGSGGFLPKDATFIGTTGLNGHANRFFVDPACVPAAAHSAQAVRFYVQGVTDSGNLLPWEDCVFADANDR